MGYSYGYQNGRQTRACDKCGRLGGTRLHKCPAGYCRPHSLCAPCAAEAKRSGGQWAEVHAGCFGNRAAMAKRETEIEAMRAAGEPVRCAAMGYFDGSDRVRVLFAFDAMQERCVGYDMDTATYRALPLLEPATPDTFRAIAYGSGHGPLTDAPSTFDDMYARQEATA